MTTSINLERDEEVMDQQTIDQGLRQLQKQGYNAKQVGEKLVVQDPVHRCGTGPYAGQLLLAGYAECTLTSSKAVFKFLDARS